MRLHHTFLSTFLFVIIGPLLIAEPLTLEDCISLAKENNLQLLQAKIDIEQARAGVTDANSSYYPSLGLSTKYGYSSDFSESGTGSFSTGINAQYTLYKGGSIRANSKIAKTKLKIAEENYRQKERELIFSVKQAFFKILQTQDRISLINNVLKRRKENLTLIQLNYNVGRESEANVKQAEVSLLQTEYDYVNTEQELALAKLELSRLLNQSDEIISIKYEDRVSEFPLLDSLIALALEARPEIKILKANQELLTAQITQAKSNYLPSVSVSSSYGLAGGEFLQQKSSWSVGIGLTQPIFNGFATKAKVKEAKLAEKQNLLSLEYMKTLITSEVKQAYANWQLAIKNLEVREKTLEATRTTYQLTKLQYEQGRTSYFFLQQRENDLTQAENSYVNGLYTRRIAIADLEKAISK